MAVGGEANRVSVSIAPRKRLDGILRVCDAEWRPQDRTVANAVMHGAIERRHGGAGTCRIEGRITTGFYSAARVEDVVAQHDILTWNILLIGAASIVTTDDAAIGRRSLRPVDPSAVECQLLGWMIARRQLRDESRGDSASRIDDDDARAVVLPGRMRRLVRVGREQPPAFEAQLEPDVDRGPGWLEPDADRGRLAQGPQPRSVLIEYEDVRGEWIRRIEVSRSEV